MPTLPLLEYLSGLQICDAESLFPVHPSANRKVLPRADDKALDYLDLLEEQGGSVPFLSSDGTFQGAISPYGFVDDIQEARGSRHRDHLESYRLDVLLVGKIGRRIVRPVRPTDSVICLLDWFFQGAHRVHLVSDEGELAGHVDLSDFLAGVLKLLPELSKRTVQRSTLHSKHATATLADPLLKVLKKFTQTRRIAVVTIKGQLAPVPISILPAIRALAEEPSIIHMKVEQFLGENAKKAGTVPPCPLVGHLQTMGTIFDQLLAQGTVVVVDEKESDLVTHTRTTVVGTLDSGDIFNSDIMENLDTMVEVEGASALPLFEQVKSAG